MRNSYVKRLLGAHELLANLVLREVRGKYRRTFFGQLWSLLNPLASMVVYTIVFSFIIRANPPPGDPSGIDAYPLWLLAGLLPWHFFAHSVTGGISSIISNGSLIKKVYFPRALLPLANTGSNGLTFLIELGVLAVALTLFGGFVLPWLPLAALFVVVLAFFAVGVGMLLAILNVYFRDVQHFTGIVLQLWLYLTPIIYPIRLVEDAAARHGEWILTLYRLNPMERFVAVFRATLYDNRLPDVDDMLWCVGWAAVAFGIGFNVFRSREKKLAELL
jgi:ABC-type polysaccharide/polyol phosphate export permease